MSIIWDIGHTSAGIGFSFEGWLYQLHCNYVIIWPGAGPFIVGGYK